MNSEYTSLKVARQQHSGRFCSYKWKRLKPHNCLEGAQTLLSIGYRESSPSRPFSDVNNIHSRADDKMVSVAAKASLRKEMKVVLKGLSKEARFVIPVLLFIVPLEFHCCSEHSVLPLSTLPSFMLLEQSSRTTW